MKQMEYEMSSRLSVLRGHSSSLHFSGPVGIACGMLTSKVLNGISCGKYEMR